MYALVTGASSGIGIEIARLLAKKKYDLIIVARREERLKKIKKELESRYGIHVVIMQYDLSKEENCKRLFKSCEKYPIEVLVNNAGFGKVGYCSDVPMEQELDMVKTNIIAVFILTKLFIRTYSKGYILNVSSVAAFQPGPVMAVYGATKSFVYSFSLAVNYELKKQRRNIHVTTLCPGPVNTEFNQVADADFDLKSISPKRCAAAALNGMFKRKDIVIPGIRIKLLHAGSKFAPVKAVLPVEYRIQVKKTKIRNR